MSIYIDHEIFIPGDLIAISDEDGNLTWFKVASNGTLDVASVTDLFQEKAREEIALHRKRQAKKTDNETTEKGAAEDAA